MRNLRAPRGTTLRCKGWVQEAALRMLHNNLDPEVAERPEDLVVYGGTGKAARDWASFDAIARTLRTLADDETLLVQSGRPVGVLRTHEWAPRVLLANSNLVGDWATWEEFRRLEALGHLGVEVVVEHPVGGLLRPAEARELGAARGADGVELAGHASLPVTDSAAARMRPCWTSSVAASISGAR